MTHIHVVRALTCMAFAVQLLVVPISAHAEGLALPMPGTMVHLSPPFQPAVLKGIKIHPEDPFKFDFILDTGSKSPPNVSVGGPVLEQESQKLIKYFLAALTVPEKDLWVNLSPYEKDRIVPESFGQTDMGRDLLAQDYLLKQITATLIYPDDEVGKQFWSRIYEHAATAYGTTQVPVNTFNKVWIVPGKAVIYENAKAGTAYVVEAELKVMLEEDYLSLEKHHGIQKNSVIARSEATKQSKDTNVLGSQAVRDIVIPQLERDVNHGQNFAQLRQVYHSLILAAWYKKKIKDSLLKRVFTDQRRVDGLLPLEGSGTPEAIYRRYLESFKKGVYNIIREDVDPVTRQAVPRKYFSGGMKMDFAMSSLSFLNILPPGMRPKGVVVQAKMEPPQKVNPFSSVPLKDALASYHGQKYVRDAGNAVVYPALGIVARTLTDEEKYESGTVLLALAGQKLGGLVADVLLLGDTLVHKDAEPLTPAVINTRLELIQQFAALQEALLERGVIDADPRLINYGEVNGKLMRLHPIGLVDILGPQEDVEKAVYFGNIIRHQNETSIPFIASDRFQIPEYTLNRILNLKSKGTFPGQAMDAEAFEQHIKQKIMGGDKIRPLNGQSPPMDARSIAQKARDAAAEIAAAIKNGRVENIAAVLNRMRASAVFWQEDGTNGIYFQEETAADPGAFGGKFARGDKILKLHLDGTDKVKMKALVALGFSAEALGQMRDAGYAGIYANTGNQRLLSLIERKIPGQEVPMPKLTFVKTRLTGWYGHIFYGYHWQGAPVRVVYDLKKNDDQAQISKQETLNTWSDITEYLGKSGKRGYLSERYKFPGESTSHILRSGGFGSRGEEGDRILEYRTLDRVFFKRVRNAKLVKSAIWSRDEISGEWLQKMAYQLRRFWRGDITKVVINEELGARGLDGQFNEGFTFEGEYNPKGRAIGIDTGPPDDIITMERADKDSVWFIRIDKNGNEKKRILWVRNGAIWEPKQERDLNLFWKKEVREIDITDYLGSAHKRGAFHVSFIFRTNGYKPKFLKIWTGIPQEGDRHYMRWEGDDIVFLLRDAKGIVKGRAFWVEKGDIWQRQVVVTKPESLYMVLDFIIDHENDGKVSTKLILDGLNLKDISVQVKALNQLGLIYFFKGDEEMGFGVAADAEERVGEVQKLLREYAAQDYSDDQFLRLKEGIGHILSENKDPEIAKYEVSSLTFTDAPEKLWGIDFAQTSQKPPLNQWSHITNIRRQKAKLGQLPRNYGFPGEAKDKSKVRAIGFKKHGKEEDEIWSFPTENRVIFERRRNGEVIESVVWLRDAFDGEWLQETIYNLKLFWRGEIQPLDINDILGLNRLVGRFNSGFVFGGDEYMPQDIAIGIGIGPADDIIIMEWVDKDSIRFIRKDKDESLKAWAIWARVDNKSARGGNIWELKERFKNPNKSLLDEISPLNKWGNISELIGERYVLLGQLPESYRFPGEGTQKQSRVIGFKSKAQTGDQIWNRRTLNKVEFQIRRNGEVVDTSEWVLNEADGEWLREGVPLKRYRTRESETIQEEPVLGRKAKELPAASQTELPSEVPVIEQKPIVEHVSRVNLAAIEKILNLIVDGKQQGKKIGTRDVINILGTGDPVAERVFLRESGLVINDNGFKISAYAEGSIEAIKRLLQKYIESNVLELEITRLKEEIAQILDADAAQVSNPGGIDLTSDQAITISEAGEIQLRVDGRMLEQFKNVSGLVPVIVNIKPLGDARQFLGG